MIRLKQKWNSNCIDFPPMIRIPQLDKARILGREVKEFSQELLKFSASGKLWKDFLILLLCRFYWLVSEHSLVLVQYMIVWCEDSIGHGIWRIIARVYATAVQCFLCNQKTLMIFLSTRDLLVHYHFICHSILYPLLHALHTFIWWRV